MPRSGIRNLPCRALSRTLQVPQVQVSRCSGAAAAGAEVQVPRALSRRGRKVATGDLRYRCAAGRKVAALMSQSLENRWIKTMCLRCEGFSPRKVSSLVVCLPSERSVGCVTYLRCVDRHLDEDYSIDYMLGKQTSL